ncbi:MAG: hypothetical protein LBV69_00760 [Bacteroidales bacterium]|jgi:hypothetical protein|nr:hypothetical protein [Bacteroidales bacterium]
MEIKPNKIKRFNQSFWGLIFGIILPTICFFGVFLYFYISADNDLFTFKSFYMQLQEKKIFIPVISACVIPNLLLYVIFKKLDYWYAIKGLVGSILFFVVVVLILKFI